MPSQMASKQHGPGFFDMMSIKQQYCKHDSYYPLTFNIYFSSKVHHPILLYKYEAGASQRCTGLA